jgi:hypothetical protein
VYSTGNGVEDGKVDRVSVGVTSDDEVVVLCKHDHLPLFFRKLILDGIGPGRGHLSRQHCEGSRLKADKLLIKLRRVGQVGGGHSRDRSNARHTYRRPVFSRVTSCGRHQPAGPAQSGHHKTHSVLVGAAQPGRVGVGEVDRDTGVASTGRLGELLAAIPGQRATQLIGHGGHLSGSPTASPQRRGQPARARADRADLQAASAGHDHPVHARLRVVPRRRTAGRRWRSSPPHIVAEAGAQPSVSSRLLRTVVEFSSQRHSSDRAIQ